MDNNLSKYQHCFEHSDDGLFYAWSDVGRDFRLKPGALPSPFQETPEKRAQADAIREDARMKYLRAMFEPAPISRPWQPSWLLRRLLRWTRSPVV